MLITTTAKTVTRLITLYETCDAAEPGKGHAEKAAEWRAKLAEEMIRTEE